MRCLSFEVGTMLKKLLAQLKERYSSSPQTSESQSYKPEELTDTDLIYKHIEKYGVEDKDACGESDADSITETLENLVPPVKSQKESSGDDTEAPATDFEYEDLSLFEEDDSVGDAEQILAYVDAHGVEIKASDTEHHTESSRPVYRSKRAHEIAIDLHGLRKEGARRRIARGFQEARERGAKQLLIIHGRGNHSAGGKGLLKELVYELLEREYAREVRSYGFAPSSEGGSGATRVVLLERKKRVHG